MWEQANQRITPSDDKSLRGANPYMPILHPVDRLRCAGGSHITLSIYVPRCAPSNRPVACSSAGSFDFHPPCLHQSLPISGGGVSGHVEQLPVVRVAQLLAFVDHQPQGLNLPLVQPQGAQVGHAFFWEQIWISFCPPNRPQNCPRWSQSAST
jgi:hypothetical protein